MAGSYKRRIRKTYSSPAARLITICLFLFFGIHWIVKHNHDDDVFQGSIRPIREVEDAGIDWNKLKYVQYVTSPEYLCNALMIWSEIEEIGSRGQRLMLYPSHWDPNEVDDFDPALELTDIARLLQSAENDYFVKLRPVDVLHENNTDHKTWLGSYTKLLAFNLTEYDRVLVIDPASVVRQNMDELFLLPDAPLAMPYVYWGEPEGWQFSSQLMLVQPSADGFSKIEAAVKSAKPDEYDMDIIDKLYKGNILRIPQRPFNLLSGEFRRNNHGAYLGSRSRKWDPDLALEQAKFMHFSDWPVPKPWIRAPKDLLNKHMPRCSKSEWFGATDCRDRAVWFKLYYDFAQRRQAVCGKGFELQSQELPPDSIYRHGRWFHPDEVG